MELKEIQNLIKFVAKSGASEVKLEMDDIKITIKTGSDEPNVTYMQQPMAAMQAAAPAPAPAASQAPTAAPATAAPASSDDKYITVKSPII